MFVHLCTCILFSVKLDPEFMNIVICVYVSPRTHISACTLATLEIPNAQVALE